MKEALNPYYISQQLTSLWPYGYHIIAEANFDTAAYVARYCTKKLTGNNEDYYGRTITDWNEVTGEITYYKEVQLEKEYSTSSKRPAIGKEWYERFKSDCYPSDFIIVDGRKVPIPKYYDKLCEEEDSFTITQQKAKRKIQAMLNHKENTLARLRTREDCKEAQLKSLSRSKI
jgi:hypothetical protein